MSTENQEELKVKELDDGSLQVGEDAPPKEEVVDEEPQDDARLNASEEHQDEDGHAEETAEEAEARRERNRARRQLNKENRKNYIESLRRELAARDEVISDLSQRVASVENHSAGNQLAQIDAAIVEAANVYNHFKEVNRKAIELADGNAAVDAQEKMFAAQQRHNALQNAKRNMAAKSQQPRPMDPRVISNAQSWIERNSWYDPSGADADSDLVTKLDSRLVQEGWNPMTPQYWDELDARVKKYLPHRAVSGYNKSQQNSASRPKVPVGGSGSESSSGGKGAYRVSPERVQALKDAGSWDDPVKRADAIRRFQEYDRTNGQSN